MSAPAVVVNGVSHRNGRWHDLVDLTERGLADLADLAALSRGGLSRYSVFDRPVREYFADCASDSLHTAGVEPSTVDAALFFSSTFSSYDDHGDLTALCRELGMQKALPVGLFQAQCSNFSYALMIAASLIRTQGMRTVLLLGADALDESRAGRLLPAAASVFSDTVLSCVVSTDATDGYAVEHIGHQVEHELSALDPVQHTLRFMDLFAARLERLCADTYARTGAGPQDFSHLVLANLALPVLRNYAGVADIPFARVPTGNIAAFGHCFAYDQLITLATLAEAEEISAGQLALVLGIGANHLFSSTVLRKL
ncbi:3-oxoacyl-[acyl-carrier-protein] synthase III family protein [Streptomyces zinciresistens K42]|uniref:3-oxoacyl-[acyl-carrier-protein] synthase III family protein n=1 Tax=Streptomyces zinciresistens K42 TaxID=700597 RepID=G2G9D5_9ACTN|nr:3-oxoacyl-[acyl-carrier-protein] synthase III C-terminal domain-containing protein [Streptomyces zinciresistens]EGX59850.1 3-oxoacyl-[acyl-carrier-protein] synthase III family protein [Streptomyces zinciresistens K42]